MIRLQNKALAKIAAVVMMMTMLLPASSFAATIDERPTPASMVLDAIFARPVMLVGTVLGAGIFTATLPVSLLGGNATEAGEKLVVTPFKGTFLRCLGCTDKNTGRALR